MHSPNPSAQSAGMTSFGNSGFINLDNFIIAVQGNRPVQKIASVRFRNWNPWKKHEVLTKSPEKPGKANKSPPFKSIDNMYGMSKMRKNIFKGCYSMFDTLVKSAKLKFRKITKASLSYLGYDLYKSSLKPPSLSFYLQQLGVRGIAADKVLCFDNDLRIQEPFLDVFDVDKVEFFEDHLLNVDGAVVPTDSNAVATKNFIVEINGEAIGFDEDHMSSLFDAEVIIVRTSLGFFWSGNGDICKIEHFFRENGFHLFDVLEYFEIRLLNGPQGQVVLAFEKNALQGKGYKNESEDLARNMRIDEARTFLSKPLAKSSSLQYLASRGSFGFKAGVLNPGAIKYNNKIIMLARGERIPWSVVERDADAFLSSVSPVLCTLDADLSIEKVEYPDFKKEIPLSRVEDYRLFGHEGEVLSSHAVISVPDTAQATDIIEPDLFDVGVGLSRLNPDTREIDYLGIPGLDKPVNKIEKNWAFFSHDKALYLIYSFKPYHLLKAKNWPGLEFETVMIHDFQLPLEAETFKLNFRNSMNPVDYDSDHILHMVHRVYPVKRYAFWAILINKKTLKPAKISAQPLLCGWQSSSTPIIYACSIVPLPDKIIIFGGINDSSMGFWEASRSLLDENWVDIP